MVSVRLYYLKGGAMLRSEFVAAISEKSGYPKTEVNKIIKTFIDVVEEVLPKENKIIIYRMGTFMIRLRKARRGRNPATGEIMQLPILTTVGFRASRRLRNIVGKKYRYSSKEIDKKNIW